MTRRALIVKLGAIGDVIMTLPAARALHERGFTVDWVCGAVVAPVLRQYDWIHVIEADDRRLLQGGLWGRLSAMAALWQTLAGRQYELCATLYYDARYRALTLPVRCKRKVVLSRTERSRQIVPGRSHASEYVRILLEEADSWNPVPALPEQMVARAEVRPVGRLVLVPGGARNALRHDGVRRWPVEKYVELASRLLAAGLTVVLAGGPDDVWTLPYFAGLEARLEIHVGSLSLMESLALLDGSSLVVSHDTGPLHLAGMTGAGIVAIFGPTDPHAFLPRRENVVALWGGAELACRPCYDGKSFAPCQRNGCVADVSVSTVEGEVMAMLAAQRGGKMVASRITELVHVRPMAASTMMA